jgi:hypothetical protein
MSRGSSNPNTGRFGGPGSSHQDRDNPGKNRQPTGHKGGEDNEGPMPGEPTNARQSRVSGGGGERDSHHTHTPPTGRSAVLAG